MSKGVIEALFSGNLTPKVACSTRSTVAFCKWAPNKPVSQPLSMLISVQTGVQVWKSDK